MDNKLAGLVWLEFVLLLIEGYAISPSSLVGQPSGSSWLTWSGSAAVPAR